jgi:hypothetical protein
MTLQSFLCSVFLARDWFLWKDAMLKHAMSQKNGKICLNMLLNQGI